MFTSEIETSYENKVKLYLEYSKKNVFVFKPKRIYEIREILKTSKPYRNNIGSENSGKRIFARMNGSDEKIFNTICTG